MTLKPILILAGLLCAASPAAAQQPAREQPRSEAHGAHGHADAENARSVLRLVSVYQMRYHIQHGRYASSLQELRLAAADSVAVWIAAKGAEGFAAVSTSSLEECAIFSGRIAPPRSHAVRADEIACRARPPRSP
jgi:hypothetical protein